MLRDVIDNGRQHGLAYLKRRRRKPHELQISACDVALESCMRSQSFGKNT
jgi:hypothetical protein